MNSRTVALVVLAIAAVAAGGCGEPVSDVEDASNAEGGDTPPAIIAGEGRDQVPAQPGTETRAATELDAAAGCNSDQWRLARADNIFKRDSCYTVTSCEYHADTGYVVYTYTEDSGFFAWMRGC